MSEATNSNPLGMSDEDFIKSYTGESSFDSEEGVDTPLESTEAEDESTESTEEESESTDSEETQVEDESIEEDEDSGSSEESVTVKDEDTSESDEDVTDKGTEESSDEYKTFYEQVTAKFKANGRDMQVNSADEVIQLMQMGANYAKKMAALKPSLSTVKILEKHGLLDDEKIGFLIDLHNKNPDAIKKLLKDSKIDPLDIDIDEASNYQPKSYKVNDAELAMDEVLDALKETPTYSQTLDVVSNKWDDASRQIIATNPQLLHVINEHLSNGVYEKVWTEVERERTFGRLTGMSDFEAYKVTGDRLFGQGTPASEPPQKKVIARKEPTVDQDRVRKKQAASPSRSKPTSSKPDDFNPLALSDEEFSRLFNSKFV